MQFSEVKKEISRIAQIEDSKETQIEVRDLDFRLNKEPKIKVVKRGSYYYFYRVEYYFDSSVHHGREDIKESLGHLSVEVYEENKERIDLMGYKELKEYLKKKEVGGI